MMASTHIERAMKNVPIAETTSPHTIATLPPAGNTTLSDADLLSERFYLDSHRSPRVQQRERKSQTCPEGEVPLQLNWHWPYVLNDDRDIRFVLLLQTGN